MFVYPLQRLNPLALLLFTALARHLILFKGMNVGSLHQLPPTISCLLDIDLSVLSVVGHRLP